MIKIIEATEDRIYRTIVFEDTETGFRYQILSCWKEGHPNADRLKVTIKRQVQKWVTED